MAIREGVAVAVAADAIRSRIVSGALGGGEPVRQEEMAGFLGLSRVPVREALRVLADQGLLEHRVHSGYFVRKRSVSELRQIYLMLEFLETKVMETIEPPSSEQLGRLGALNGEMAGYVGFDDWSPMIDLNRRFHFEVFRLSPMKVVIEEVERLWTIAAPYIAQKYTTRAQRARTIAEHDGLIASLSSFDRGGTVELLAHHRMQRGAGG